VPVGTTNLDTVSTDTALVGARLRVPLAANASFALGYDGRFGGGYEGHSGFAGLSLRW